MYFLRKQFLDCMLCAKGPNADLLNEILELLLFMRRGRACSVIPKAFQTLARSFQNPINADLRILTFVSQTNSLII
jgi:hypothetical protein